jgi:hypothetical protein
MEIDMLQWSLSYLKYQVKQQLRVFEAFLNLKVLIRLSPIVLVLEILKLAPLVS